MEMMSAPVGIDLGENKEDRDKHIILSEHMKLIPNDPNYDEGLTLSTYEDDDDDFHMKHHKRFLNSKGKLMTVKGRDSLSKHIEKHGIQKKEKEKIYGR